MIRKAEKKDIEELVILTKEFFKESLNEYGLKIGNKTIKNTLTNYVTNYIGIVAEKNGKLIGAIGGLVAKSIFDESQLLGQEVIWYITNSERKGTIGIKLIKAFEDECKKQGADLIAMVHMGNLYAETLDKFYKMRGYKLLERQYIKSLGNGEI